MNFKYVSSSQSSRAFDLAAAYSQLREGKEKEKHYICMIKRLTPVSNRVENRMFRRAR